MSVRSNVSAIIEPALPSGWLFYDRDKSLGTIAKPTVLLQHTRVVPGPYTGSHVHTITLAVVDPSQNADVMDDRLDERLDTLLPILQGIAELEFVEADRGTYPADNPQYPAWSIQLTVTTTA